MSRITGRKLLWSIALLALAGLIVSCGPGGQAVKLTEQDAGKSVELAKGDTLEVTLPGNITTGYNWEADGIDGAILKQVGEPQFKADSDAMGAGGMITLSFEAVGSGQTNLKLIYHRSFEQGVDPLKTYEATVVVK